jgi:hypothetical protein
MIGAGSREPEARRRRRTTSAIAPAIGSKTASQNQAGTLRRCRWPASAGAEALEPTWPPGAATPGLGAAEVPLDCSPCRPLRTILVATAPARRAVPSRAARVRVGNSRAGDETAPRAGVTSAASSAPSGGFARRPESRARRRFDSFASVDATGAAVALAPGEEAAAAGAGGAEAAGRGGAGAGAGAGAEAGAGAGAGGGAGLGAAGAAGCAGRNRSGST